MKIIAILITFIICSIGIFLGIIIIIGMKKIKKLTKEILDQKYNSNFDESN